MWNGLIVALTPNENLWIGYFPMIPLASLPENAPNICWFHGIWFQFLGESHLGVDPPRGVIMAVMVQGFPRGIHTPDRVPPTYYFAKILLKTAWKWKNLDQEGGTRVPGAPLDPPLPEWATIVPFSLSWACRWRTPRPLPGVALIPSHRLSSSLGSDSPANIKRVTDLSTNYISYDGRIEYEDLWNQLWALIPTKPRFNLCLLKNLKCWHQINKILSFRNGHFMQIHENWKVGTFNFVEFWNMMICKLQKSKKPKNSWSDQLPFPWFLGILFHFCTMTWNKTKFLNFKMLRFWDMKMLTFVFFMF